MPVGGQEESTAFPNPLHFRKWHQCTHDFPSSKFGNQHLSLPLLPQSQNISMFLPPECISNPSSTAHPSLSMPDLLPNLLQNPFTVFSVFTPAAATAADKSLQSCPTLCDPIDSSPPGSPVPGIL